MAKKLPRRKRDRKHRTITTRGLAARVSEVESSVSKVNLPEFKAGDTVRVMVRIQEGGKERLQAFEGLVIKRRHRTVGSAFTVRKISHGVGVERVFSETSPKVASLEVLQVGQVRRAKLYYIRELEGRAARIARKLSVSKESMAASAAAAANSAS